MRLVLPESPPLPAPLPNASCLLRANQSHSAYSRDAVTVHYRWHPLFGQTLPVLRRMVDRRGEHLFVQLPDGTVCSLPTWMFNPSCSTRYYLGPPLIAVDALRHLRDLLSSLRPSEDFGKDSANPPFMEGAIEEHNRTARVATQPATGEQSDGSRAGKQANGTGSRAGRVADQRVSRQRSKPSTRRRR